jgi:protein-arginine kinase
VQLTQKSVVVSGRIRLARNYADLPFSRPGKNPHAELCIERAVSAMQEACTDHYDLCRLSGLSPTDQLALVEKHLISKDLLKNGVVLIHGWILGQKHHLHVGKPGDGAAVGDFLPGQTPQKGGFAGAVDADDADFVTGLQI